MTTATTMTALTILSLNVLCLTQVDKICVPDVLDLVEATVEVGGVLREGWDCLQVWVVAVHTSTQTHTQQAGGHAFRRSTVWVKLKWRHKPNEVHHCVLCVQTHPGRFRARRGRVPWSPVGPEQRPGTEQLGSRPPQRAQRALELVEGLPVLEEPVYQPLSSLHPDSHKKDLDVKVQ